MHLDQFRGENLCVKFADVHQLQSPRLHMRQGIYTLSVVPPSLNAYLDTLLAPIPSVLQDALGVDSLYDVLLSNEVQVAEFIGMCKFLGTRLKPLYIEEVNLLCSAMSGTGWIGDLPIVDPSQECLLSAG